MEDHVPDTSQNIALRDRLVSVVGPVFAGDDETNILTLLTSLPNVCSHNEGLLVKPTDTVSGNDCKSEATNTDKALEFTCWLLTELITIYGSASVCEANISLQVTIMRLLATRNPKLFSFIVKDFINIGLEGKDVLFDGGTVSCYPFSSLISWDNAQPAPKVITFTDNSQLDHILTNILLVVSHLGEYLCWCTPMLDSIWLLIGNCLEGGDTDLKAASLSTIVYLLDSCGLPKNAERQDYILQCIGAVIADFAENSQVMNNEGNAVPEEDCNSEVVQVKDKSVEKCNSEVIQIKDKSVENHLADVLLAMQPHIPNLKLIFKEEMLLMLSKNLSIPGMLEKIPKVLRKAIMQCVCLLFNLLESSPHLSKATTSLQVCASCSPLVDKLVLRKLVYEDLLQAVPSANTEDDHQDLSQGPSRKRKFSETETEVEKPSVSVVNLSKWWKMALQKLSALLIEWSEAVTPLPGQIEAACDIVSVAGWIADRLPQTQVTFQFFPEPWLLSVMNSIASIMTGTSNVNIVIGMMDLVCILAWALDIVELLAIKLEISHFLLALATLPWMVSEMNFMDLKPSNIKQFAMWASKFKWNNDSKIKSKSIAVVSFMSKSLAPRWRCQIIRAAISEQETQVMLEMAMWFPMMVHQLGTVGGQQLVGEVVGAVLHSPNSDIIKAGAESLKHLLCALLKLSTIKKCMFKEDNNKPYTLSCRICSGSNYINTLNAQQVDPTLVSQFLVLLQNMDSDIVIPVAEALPAVVSHTSMTSQMISQYLSLLSHPEKCVITAFCKQLPFLVCPQSSSLQSQDSKNSVISRGEVILSHLNDLVKKNEGGSNKTMQTVSEALHHLVKCSLGGLTGGVLVLLLRCLVKAERMVKAQAQLSIHALADTLGLTLQDLYTRHRQNLAQKLAEIASLGEVGSVLSHIAEVFQWPGSSNVDKKRTLNNKLGSFITSQIHLLLPALAVRASQEARPGFLQELAECIGLRLRNILIDHFQHILAHLVFHYTSKEQEAVLNFIATTTDLHINDIRQCSVQNQVNELVLGLHDHRSAVLREFAHMRSIEQISSYQSTRSKQISSNIADNAVFESENIGEYLSPRLLGILGFIDSKLVSPSTMYKEKRSSLWSLSDLLVLMGRRYVSPVSRKVLASLKTALKLKDEEFYDIGCHAWKNFLYNLDDSTLENLIEEVVIVVTPLVKERPKQMAPVLTHILVEKPSIKSLLGNLPLLPVHEALSNINRAIAEHQLHVVSGSTHEVLEGLSSILRSLNHESLDVRFHALTRLRHLLHHNHEAVHHLSTDTDNVHPTISELFSVLLGQCREVGEEVHVAVAECLGFLCAIDPSRLYTCSNSKEDLNEVHLNIETEFFIVQLISELGRAFLAATDANTQTCASYAMQEVTRLYGIRESGSDGATPVGSRAWDRLRYHLQEIINPLLTSKYTLATNTGRSSSALPSPIYGSSRAGSFHQWLTNWTCSLVDMLDEGRANQIFNACKPIMRRDTTTSIYFLPFILVSVLKESTNNHNHILEEVLAVMSQKPVELKKEDPSLKSSEFKNLAAQTVFSAFDYLSKWVQKQRQTENVGKKSRGAFTPSTELKRVINFLEKIPANLLAQTSFSCQAYSRALLHIEAFIKDNPEQLKEHLQFLQRIYVALDEPDGVAGVAAIRREDPSLDEQVIQHKATGRLQDALGCYERLCVSRGSEEVYKGLLECYLSLDQPHSVLSISHGLLANRPELETSLNEYRIEAAWKLGQWDQLESIIEKDSSQPSWGKGVGQILLAVRARDFVAYQCSLRRLRTQQITSLSAASMEKWAYQRAYPHILRLHILTELEEMMSGLLLFNHSSDAKSRLSKESELKSSRDYQQQPLNLGELVERWEKRLALVQTSYRYLEPILSFRRTLLELGKEWTEETNPALSSSLAAQLESTWLHSAKVARKSGYTQQGEWALLGAGFGRDVFVERAKWHWVKGEQHQAVTTLNRGIEKFFANCDSYKGDVSNGAQDERVACGQAKLLLARYSEESATLEVNAIKQYYRDACEMNKQWEAGHFHLAMYYDRILSSLDVKEKPVEWIHHIVLSFGKSLQYGCCHIYESMPRMLGLWLEFGTKVSELATREEKTRGNRKNSVLDSYREKLANLNGGIGSLLDRLPHYMFMTALPQLISRICHSNNDVFLQLCKIIATMLSSFPQQAMWHMIAVSKSSYHMRVTRCIEIFETAKRMNSGLSKFIADATKLADKFLELSNKHVEKGVPQISLNNLLRALPRLLSDATFSNIILPLQHQMMVTLPSSSSNLHSHDPFPRAAVYLTSIEDQIEIMQSLQLPKKITLRGSDGRLYIMMCKPKDDLRKDCRLMEFNNFVNRCLLREPESRKRDLHIRTYAVVPLNEECGLIEWIQNLSGLRQILIQLYREAGTYMTGQELKQNMCKLDTPLATKREIFLKKLIPRHPPMFGTWFLKTFPNPQSWLRARLSYCRTTGVMSMVGYILGLGDRHGENILFDASCGDTVHVDFNCLFNKGETFDWPERVPFRLTHNMVNAMGPTGYEGIYRKTCEVTLRVMREQRNALMSVLRPFVHDPLVEWSRGDKSAKSNGTGEINNEKAQMHVNNIEQRLSGQIRTKARGFSIPLSVEGQVNSLIEEATSIDNLCQLYIGWAAYM